MALFDTILGYIPIIAVVVVAFIVLAVLRISYVVVPPNEIHAVVNRSMGRKIYSSRKGYKSSYWRIPLLQRRIILPAENVQLQINGISLRDSQMAKFKGDVVSWINISDPELASERLGNVTGEKAIFDDVSNLIQAVTRNTSMYWTILDILKTRKEFSVAVATSVNKEFTAWGMTLVELEVIHFLDDEKYTIISDLEKRQSSIINAETRKLVAGQTRDAEIVESNARKDKDLQVATNDETARVREIQRDETLGKRKADMEKMIADQQQIANVATIEKERTITVGRATIEKEAAVTTAEGSSSAQILTEGKYPAEKARLIGEGEGEAIRAKMYAEADGTNKRAEALKLYNEAGIKLEYLKAIRDVEITRWNNWGTALGNAKINVYSGGEGGNLLGMPMNPASAFSLGAFSAIAKEQGGVDIEKIGEALAGKALPIVDIKTGANPKSKMEK
jgi:uncharacterized membrane protein YqiK